jgi:hypothetical protein
MHVYFILLSEYYIIMNSIYMKSGIWNTLSYI